MRFDIPKSYNFHKSKSKDVEVDLIRIFVGGNSDDDHDSVCDPNDKHDKIQNTDEIGENCTIRSEQTSVEDEA